MQEILDFLDSLHWSPAEEIIADGKLRRYKMRGDKEQNCSYRFDETGGWVRNHREGITEAWKGSKPVSPDKLKQYKAKQKAYQQEVMKAKKEAAKKAQEIYDSASSASPIHPYLVKKKIKPHNAKQVDNALIIPAYGEDGSIKTFQRITLEGEKFFLEGGEAAAAYNLLYEEGEDTQDIIIAEGFATAATIREVLGLPVAVAFSASNVPKVAEILHKLHPGSNLIVAADNDRHSINGKGEPFNAGVHYAEMAKNIATIRPVQFADGEKGTDYNDLFLLHGSEILEQQIYPLPVVASNSKFFDEEDFKPNPQEEAPFRVLGYNEGLYYYYPKVTQQIVALSAPQHNDSNFLRLARLKHWEKYKNKERIDYTRAADELIGKAHEIGVFRPEEQIRGRGVWVDGKDVVFNSGQSLFVNGAQMPMSNYHSEYIYIREKTIAAPLDPCDNKEAHRFREICEMGSWKHQVSGTLLAGWCVVSMACSTLKWRPHIWLTGASSSGKSTIIECIIETILGSLALKVDGNTTEAAIRQKLMSDSKAIIYDEAESETQRSSAIMEGVLDFARKSSSGGVIIKGSPTGDTTTYHAKSTFCFSGINPAIKHFADETRVSMLELRKSTDDEAWRVFSRALSDEITPIFARRLLARVLQHLPILLENCRVFANASTEIFKDRRAADQIGTLLAGVYLLHSPKVANYETALRFVKENELRPFTAMDSMKDCEKLLAYICSRKIRYEGGAPQYEYTVGRLISMWKKGSNKTDAEMALRLHGVWPRDEGVWIANDSQGMSDLLKGTQWAAKWNRSLSDLEPDMKTTAQRTFVAGQAHTRSLVVPYKYFEVDEPTNQEGEEE